MDLENCVVCGNEIGGAHSCKVCGAKVRVICGESEEGDEEGYGQQVTCNNCALRLKPSVKSNCAKQEKQGNASQLSFLTSKLVNTDKSLAKQLSKKSKSSEPGSAPCVCLKCGITLSRSSDSFKARHMEQKHKELQKTKLTIFVPANHEDAKKAKAKFQNTSDKKSEGKPESSKPRKDISTNDFVVTDVSEEMEKEKLSVKTQKSIEGFINYGLEDDENPENSGEESSITSSLNEIKLMLSAMAIHPKPKFIKEPYSTGLEDLQHANNLMEISHPDIKVEAFDESCKITCACCHNFISSSRSSVQKLLPTNQVFGTGLLYNEEKKDILLSGGNQIWYSFKSSLIEHLKCHLTRSGGQFHFKAKQFEFKTKKLENETIKASTISSEYSHRGGKNENSCSII